MLECLHPVHRLCLRPVCPCTLLCLSASLHPPRHVSVPPFSPVTQPLLVLSLSLTLWGYSVTTTFNATRIVCLHGALARPFTILVVRHSSIISSPCVCVCVCVWFWGAAHDGRGLQEDVGGLQSQCNAWKTLQQSPNKLSLPTCRPPVGRRPLRPRSSAKLAGAKRDSCVWQLLFSSH